MAVKKEKMQAVINNSQFYGIKWDGQAIDAVATLARALEAQAVANKRNSDAVERLIDVFASQNITIESLVRVDG
jgi:hypothetical protein